MTNMEINVNGRFADEQIDTLLLPLLQAADEAALQTIVAGLISKHAEPIIKDIIKFKLRVSLSPIDANQRNQDAEDLFSEARVQVVAELREFKNNSNNRAIKNFRSYVATIAYHICYEYLRKRYPRRARLKDRLRYLLTHHHSFALWQHNNEWLCGFLIWQQQQRKAVRARPENRFFDNLRAGNFDRGSGADPLRIDIAELLAQVFNELGAPVEFELLVNLIVELLGIQELAEQHQHLENLDALNDRLAGSALSADKMIDQRNYLRQLWLEIGQLPPRQRAALLLNLKDDKGRGIIVLFQLLNIATMDQIAAALNISADRFAELWNELPLDDILIGELLGITRQQVINLRKSARERLARRMQAFQ